MCQVLLESAHYGSLHTYVNIHFLLLRPSCLSFLFFLFFKRIEIITRTMAQKTQLAQKSALPASGFLSFDVLGVILPQNPQNVAPVGKSQPNSKSRITSKPFKIDKKCQLNMNMNIKSGSPFQNPSCRIA